MTIARAISIVVGLAAAGAAGAGVASYVHENRAESAEPEADGFSAGQLASIEGIISAQIGASAASTPAPAAGGLTDAEVAEIETTVRTYLMREPQIMRDVFQALEVKEEQEQADKLKSFMAENADALHGGTEGLVLGNPDGDVTLVEFFDYNCGYCKRALGDLMTLLDTDSNLKVVMKEFPILSPGSREAAQVSLAVAKQGDKYRDFHAQLMQTPGQVNMSKAMRLADELGLDMEQLKADIASEETEAELNATMELAQAIGIRGTPAYVIGDELVPGAIGLDNLRSMIQQLRESGESR